LEGINFRFFFVQPKDDQNRVENMRTATEFCLNHPKWRLSIQSHKYIGRLPGGVLQSGRARFRAALSWKAAIHSRPGPDVALTNQKELATPPDYISLT
jgi:hypothetical protein